jgi:hypothetical protein
MEALGVPPRSLLEPAARRKQFFDSSGAPYSQLSLFGCDVAAMTSLQNGALFFWVWVGPWKAHRFAMTWR